ncbi:Keratin, type I cytoskeletal 18 [Plecturocebus cupreus]
MSFTTCSTVSTNYQSLGSVQAPSYGTRLVSSRASIYADTGDSGSQISMSCSTSFRGNIGVRSLETKNQKLERKIQEHLEKMGPQVKDWSHYFKTIEDLRAQILANTVDNAHIVLQINNACLAADHFRVKYDTELAKRQSVESYLHGFCKVIDDTNVTQLQMETEIEALREELLFMKKNHEEEVKAQIANSGLTIEIDAPKSQDLTKIMADIQARYDELAWKNQEELDKYWPQ